MPVKRRFRGYHTCLQRRVNSSLRCCALNAPRHGNLLTCTTSVRAQLGCESESHIDPPGTFCRISQQKNEHALCSVRGGGLEGGGGDLLSQQQIPLLPARVSLSHHSNVFISGFKDMLNGYLCVMATWLRLRARCAGTSRIFAEQAVGDVDRLARGLRPPLPVEVKEGGA